MTVSETVALPLGDGAMDGGMRGARTRNLEIKSLLLYPLS